MKKLLLLLLIIGCEENSTEPEVVVDCLGIEGGDAIVDCVSNECTTEPENVELWDVCYSIAETDLSLIHI